MQQSQLDPSTLTPSTSRKRALTGALTGFEIHSGISLSPRGISTWNAATIFESKSQPKLLSRILQCTAQRGWRDECAEERSCSFTRSRASTLRLLFLPSSFCLRMLSPSHWLVFAGLLSLPLFPTLPSLSITHSCLSLSLLLSSLTLPFFLPAGALPPSPSQLSNFSDCACFVNSKSRLLPTKTHTDKNWLLQTMFYSLSLLLPLLPLSPTDNEISSDAVILLMSFTSHQKE